ncbi:NERD domain-containing protein [Streptomyces sp. WAC05374]|uniref:nuclease-related domain-containing protein n=1 Tax=Streptomyces sp. WAC05374 TaxID=2487420 RepID=UPI000F85E31D|nr:nuclease-related domain-containing protein [Streptomyces sp. WAC05374]RST11609.1 NERD domain-containing protein [Streptomyces sp. WAC05374]TDF43043.1 NERD domain-containing protein [Streptomyces sp. WAC05374]TDF46597.1 NERD domain-containing protein [Streptomyces sp. WAC05374]TDF53616.1 NERD domain-containing protein [Streptomyces sp. WAC05374]
MTALRVTPAGPGGRHRLRVSLPDGRDIAWYDRDSGRISLLSEAYEDEVVAALAPYVTGEVSIGPPSVPTASDLARLSLHPDDDLAPNRPGEALHAALDGAPARRLRKDPRPAELAAHQRVGDALDGLDAAGWRVLHCVPLPGGARIDHLAIGPAGVFAVRTLAARGRRVRIAGPYAATGRGEPEPHLRWARRAADRAAHALATAVRPVLAVADPGRLEVPPAPDGVRVLRDGEIPSLARLGAVLKPVDVEALYATARDRRTWLAV